MYFFWMTAHASLLMETQLDRMVFDPTSFNVENMCESPCDILFTYASCTSHLEIDLLLIAPCVCIRAMLLGVQFLGCFNFKDISSLRVRILILYSYWILELTIGVPYK